MFHNEMRGESNSFGVSVNVGLLTQVLEVQRVSVGRVGNIQSLSSATMEQRVILVVVSSWGRRSLYIGPLLF